MVKVARVFFYNSVFITYPDLNGAIPEPAATNTMGFCALIGFCIEMISLWTHFIIDPIFSVLTYLEQNPLRTMPA